MENKIRFVLRKIIITFAMVCMSPFLILMWIFGEFDLKDLVETWIAD